MVSTMVNSFFSKGRRGSFRRSSRDKSRQSRRHSFSWDMLRSSGKSDSSGLLSYCADGVVGRGCVDGDYDTATATASTTITSATSGSSSGGLLKRPPHWHSANGSAASTSAHSDEANQPQQPSHHYSPRALSQFSSYSRKSTTGTGSTQHARNYSSETGESNGPDVINNGFRRNGSGGSGSANDSSAHTQNDPFYPSSITVKQQRRPSRASHCYGNLKDSFVDSLTTYDEEPDVGLAFEEEAADSADGLSGLNEPNGFGNLGLLGELQESGRSPDLYELDHSESTEGFCNHSNDALDTTVHRVPGIHSVKSMGNLAGIVGDMGAEEETLALSAPLPTKNKEENEENMLNNIQDLSECMNLLRRTRAVSALANRLMVARDEAKCIDEATILMVEMFDLECVSFGMLTGPQHFILKRVQVRRCFVVFEGGPSDPSPLGPEAAPVSPTEASQSSIPFELQYSESPIKHRLSETDVGLCSRTLKQHYVPQTQQSQIKSHQILSDSGFQSHLATPILVNGNKCAGCILLQKREEDAFSQSDRILISDIASLLGANIYAKRLKRASDQSNQMSREILHSFIPPKVLGKVEEYWDSKAIGRSHRRRSDFSVGSTSYCESVSTHSKSSRSNSWNVASCDMNDHETSSANRNGNIFKGIVGKLKLVEKMNHKDEDEDDNDVGVIVSGLDQFDLTTSTSRALYAENVKNVCIIFTDIVGFSRISMTISPIKVMDMLQDLFHRFDNLCDVHGVMKLETIGDAYLCATNLMEEEEEGVSAEEAARDAAVRALSMAKDMVRETRNVRIPHVGHGSNPAPFEILKIRVGIHVGDITCGVLGQRLPKFTTCGNAVNMAARMEQTSQPNMIRVTKEFHDLVGNAEYKWMMKEDVPLKNMGVVETYLLDPMRHGRSCSVCV